MTVAEQNLVADSVNVETALIDADAPQVEGWTERGFEEIEVDVGEIEIVRVVGQEIELDTVALVLQIVSVVERADVYGAPAATDCESRVKSRPFRVMFWVALLSQRMPLKIDPAKAGGPLRGQAAANTGVPWQRPPAARLDW